MLEQARKLLNSVSAEPNAPASGPHWKSLHTLLKKAPCDQMRLARFIAERNVEAMRKLLEEVAVAPPKPPRGAYQSSQPAAAADTAPADAASLAARSTPRPEIIIRSEKPTPQQLKTALAAFKKRLKLTKLDQESRINSHSPLSGGTKSGIIAILPPNLYPKTYWEELEKQGQIRNTGGGFYELVEKAKPLRGAAAAAVAGAAGGAESTEEPEGAAGEPEADPEAGDEGDETASASSDEASA